MRLHKEWTKGGYKKEKKPSIDRINHKKPYTIYNIQMMTWAENRYKQTMERRRRKGPVVQSKNGEVIAIHRSQRDAVLNTGYLQSMLSQALTGKYKTAYGYEWNYDDKIYFLETIYENPELLNDSVNT